MPNGSGINHRKPMSTIMEKEPSTTSSSKSLNLPGGRAGETAYGYPRNFLGNRFVYVVVSPRARGLSIGINFNPDKKCNFDCVYCEVDRTAPGRDQKLNIDVMADELTATVNAAISGTLRDVPLYRNLPAELLQLRHVTLSGDGEPTLSPVFAEALQTVAHIRALGRFPFFKIVLVSNATGFDLPEVQRGLKLLTRQDEVWAKLDVGTQSWMDVINKSQVPLDKILSNILLVARSRPVIIQSLFASVDNADPPVDQIEQYALRLRELKEAGAQIPLVQIYSASRPVHNTRCRHLPLRSLSQIAQTVRRVSGLKAEVF